MESEKEETRKIEPEIKEIVLFRIKSSKLPQNIRLSIGELSKEPMTIRETIKHVEQEDEIGRKIIEMELNYLKALKKGLIPQIQNG